MDSAKFRWSGSGSGVVGEHGGKGAGEGARREPESERLTEMRCQGTPRLKQESKYSSMIKDFFNRCVVCPPSLARLLLLRKPSPRPSRPSAAPPHHTHTINQPSPCPSSSLRSRRESARSEATWRDGEPDRPEHAASTDTSAREREGESGAGAAGRGRRREGEGGRRS